VSRPRRVTFGPAAFLLGAALTVFVFGLPFGPPGYLFSIGAALLLGMPLALLVGMLLRSVRNQWIHILAIGGAGIVTGVVTLVFLVGTRGYSMWGLALWAGFCAALGRSAVVQIVKVHDKAEHGHDAGPSPAAAVLEP
jgi:hypothetical protein